MEFIYFVNLIFILVVNILFLFSGICLNSLVIVSFWRSVQNSKEVVLFHDNGFVLLRFTCGCSWSSINRSSRDVMVD